MKMVKYQSFSATSSFFSAFFISSSNARDKIQIIYCIFLVSECFLSLSPYFADIIRYNIIHIGYCNAKYPPETHVIVFSKIGCHNRYRNRYEIGNVWSLLYICRYLNLTLRKIAPMNYVWVKEKLWEKKVFLVPHFLYLIALIFYMVCILSHITIIDEICHKYRK